MRQAKNLLLILVIPFMLVGCGCSSDFEKNIWAENAQEEVVIINENIEVLGDDKAEVFTLGITEDPVKQIDVINDSIEQLDEVLLEA